ncbi:hypothetical protein B0H11DRAFT_1308320 [Mycena galericulata]|nr:hypothetical protein B0H11DRAFT_1308320 [Mycena galericulata]
MHFKWIASIPSLVRMRLEIRGHGSASCTVEFALFLAASGVLVCDPLCHSALLRISHCLPPTAVLTHSKCCCFQISGFSGCTHSRDPHGIRCVYPLIAILFCYSVFFSLPWNSESTILIFSHVMINWLFNAESTLILPFGQLGITRQKDKKPPPYVFGWARTTNFPVQCHRKCQEESFLCYPLQHEHAPAVEPTSTESLRFLYVIPLKYWHLVLKLSLCLLISVGQRRKAGFHFQAVPTA